MKISKLVKTLLVLLGGFAISGVALADDDSDSDSDTAFSRIAPTTVSPSGNSVAADCGSFPNASATLNINKQKDGITKTTIKLKDARPNTIYTVWLRVKGNDTTGSFGGSPLTGGGSTPLAAGSALDGLEAISPWTGSPGSPTPANGFTTDANGNGELKSTLDFPLTGGAYPFNRISATSLASIQNLQNAGARGTPLAIVDPSDVGVSGPFMLRMVSHCTDGLGHGLVPGNREGWFQIP